MEGLSVLIVMFVIFAIVFVTGASAVAISLDMSGCKPSWWQRRRLMQAFKRATANGTLEWMWTSHLYRGIAAEANYGKYRIKLTFDEQKGRLKTSYCFLYIGGENVVSINLPYFKLYPLWDLKGLGRLVVMHYGADYKGKPSDEELVERCLEDFAKSR